MDTAQNESNTGAPVITSNTTSEDKSKNFKKVGLGVGVFVLLVILSGLAYLGYTKYLSPKTTSQSLEDGFSSSRKINVDKINFYTERLKNLEDKSDFFLAANLNTTIRGVVTSSETKNEVLGGVRYVYNLELESIDGNLLTYRFTQGDLERMKIFLIENGGRTELKPEGVKVGYYAILRSSIDFLDSSIYDDITLDVTERGIPSDQ